MRKKIRRVFWLYFMLFFLIISYLLKFVVFDSKKIVSNPYNPRLAKSSNDIKKGNIIGANGEVLVQSVKSETGYIRKYNYGKEFSHIIGYKDFGGFGIEAANVLELQTLQMEVLQRMKNIFLGEELKGNSLVLTIDESLQQFCYEQLDKKKGAIVVMEPSTGKILSMVSYPNFDPNNLSENWDTVKDNTEDSPLLNRATQGLYPPGSIFKIITATAALRETENFIWQDFTYNCTGSATFGNNKIRCFDSNVHGTVNMEQAIDVSCNTFFVALGDKLGGDNLASAAETVLFNKEYDYSYEYKKSSFVLNNSSSQSELIETSIGQGKTLVTPLHMAMIISSIGNGGIMMKPYVVDSAVNEKGKVVEKNMPEFLAMPFTNQESEQLKNMMRSVVTSGTAIAASVKGVSVAGKTGTAENSTGEDHKWFICLAETEDKTIAISIVLENSPGKSKAVAIAREVIKFYY